jgi:hypothetical protein
MQMKNRGRTEFFAAKENSSNITQYYFEKLGSTPIFPIFKTRFDPYFSWPIARQRRLCHDGRDAQRAAGHHPARIGSITGTSTQPPGPAMNRPQHFRSKISKVVDYAGRK